MKCSRKSCTMESPENCLKQFLVSICSCLMKEVNNTILEGQSSRRHFCHSVAKLDKKIFYYSGIFVAWSILHGGPGLPVLSDSVYKLLLGVDVKTLDTDDVDNDVLEKIQVIKDGTDQELFHLTDWLIDQGLECIIPPFTKVKREEMIQQILINTIHLRVHAEMTQFKDGLQLLGLYSIMKEFPDELNFLLTHKEDILTSQKLKSLYTINFSNKGHNYRPLEEDTIYSFECFLQECDGDNCEVNISEVLLFWTGSDSIPPLGFGKQLEISFVSNNDLGNKLPVAHTCGMTLELPRGITEPDKMMKVMTIAVHWGGEFHLA